MSSCGGTSHLVSPRLIAAVDPKKILLILDLSPIRIPFWVGSISRCHEGILNPKFSGRVGKLKITEGQVLSDSFIAIALRFRWALKIH